MKLSEAVTLQTQAVVFDEGGRIDVRQLALSPATPDDIVVDIDFSGISTGTERLLWSGKMPPFPGLAYPLVPGYESVGRVVKSAHQDGAFAIGERVFVPGARCYGDVQGLFGGAASTVVIPKTRAVPISGASTLEPEETVLLALAATARHALLLPEVDPETRNARNNPGRQNALPDLIVGHGVLGRLIARLTLALGGHAPVVWETDPQRHDGAKGYRVIDPADDDRRDYLRILDASGNGELLDELIARMKPGGEIVLAGFYADRLSFDFAPAFMRETTFRIAAQWQPSDLQDVIVLVEAGRLALSELITHAFAAENAVDAYRIAFTDPSCLKMILDWRELK